MGENDTAGLDPIFFFHHAFVDRVFWLWQQRHRATDELSVIDGYPGTNTVDAQGPTPGVVPNAWLTLDSPLNPFKRKDGDRERPYTSRDCINIETQLGYTYGPGSLERRLAAVASEPADPVKVVRVSGINRGAIRGSFMISAFVQLDGKRQRVGTEAILSRWHVQGCANCQAHLEAQAFIPLRGVAAASAGSVEVEVRTRDGVLGAPPAGERTLAMAVAKKPFRVEIR